MHPHYSCSSLQVHVAHVIVDGVITGPRTAKYNKPKEDMIDADAIADTYWNLHIQHKCARTPPLTRILREGLNLSACRSCWTQELDIRPYTEKW